jgi:hypothetical protein
VVGLRVFPEEGLARHERDANDAAEDVETVKPRRREEHGPEEADVRVEVLAGLPASTALIERKIVPPRRVRQRKSFNFRMSPRLTAARAWTIVTDEQIRMKVFMAVRGMFRTDAGAGQSGVANRSTM